MKNRNSGCLTTVGIYIVISSVKANYGNTADISRNICPLCTPVVKDRYGNSEIKPGKF